MNLSNPILSLFMLYSISWQWIPQILIYIYLVWKSASFCWFYTCDPFHLGACQFLHSEKEWVVNFWSLSLHNFWFYRLLWHLLSSVFYRILIVPCIGIVPWLAALRGLKKVMGSQTKSLWRPSRGQQQYVPSWSILLYSTIHSSGFSSSRKDKHYSAQLLLECCDPSSCSASSGSKVPHLICFSSVGPSPLLGFEPPSGRLARAPTSGIEKVIGG